MHIKFLKHGTGNAQLAVDYLLQDRDFSGELRAGITVLFGDPHRVALVADDLDFKHKYTSGVIAWAPEDQPNDKQIDQVLQEFEATAWAGLEPERCAWSAILHRDKKGGCHIHVFAARVDLESGKSLNIAPPGWQKAFNPLRDWMNWTHGWARPDDPDRQRDHQPGYQAYIDAAQLRVGLKVEPDQQAFITQYLLQQIKAGVIKDRAGIVDAFLDAKLEVPRKGDKYLTVKDPESGQRWRLKGAIYEREFTNEQLAESVTRKDGKGRADDQGCDPECAGEAFERLSAIRKHRAIYNRKRYGGSGAEPSKKAEAQPPVELDQTADHRVEPLYRYLCRKLGADAIFDQEYSGAIADSLPINRADRESTPTVDQVERLGHGVIRGSRWSVSRAPSGEYRENWLENWKTASYSIIERLGDEYDRIRESLAQHFEAIIEAIQAGSTEYVRANQAISRASQSVGYEATETKRAIQTVTKVEVAPRPLALEPADPDTLEMYSSVDEDSESEQ